MSRLLVVGWVLLLIGLQQMATVKAQDYEYEIYPSSYEGHSPHQPIYIGLSFSRGATSPRGLQTERTLGGIFLSVEWYKNQPNFVIDGTEYRIYLYILNNHDSQDEMMEHYQWLADTPDIPFLIGPMNSDWGLLVREIVDGKKVTIHPTASADGTYVNSATIFPVMPAISKIYSAAMTELRLSKATSYSFIMEDHPAMTTACLGSIPLAQRNKISLSCNFTVPLSLSGLDETNTKIYQDTIEYIANNCQQDAVMMCAYGPMYLTVLEHARSIGFSPKVWMANPGSGMGDSDLRWFVMGGTPWSRFVSYPPDPYFGTPQDYSDLVFDTYGRYPDQFDGAGSVIFLLWWNSLNVANSLDEEEVLFAVSRSDFTSFWGTITYKGDHLPLAESVIFQYLPGRDIEAVVVAPSIAQTDNLLYPVPGWDQRQSDFGWFKESGDIVIAVLFGICTLITLCMAVGLWIFRAHPIFRRTQVIPSLIMMLGAIVCYTSVFCWLQYVTDAGCAALPWILTTGFILLIGTMNLKTWRVWRLMKASNNFQVVKVPVAHLIGFLVLLLVLLYALLIPWTIVSPLEAELEQPAPYFESEDYLQCVLDDTAAIVFVSLVVAYLGLLLLSGVIGAFAIRNIKVKELNESKMIAFAIYNLLIFTALGAGLVGSSVGGPEASFWIRCTFILFVPLSTLLLIFVPKFWIYYKRDSYDDAQYTGTTPSLSKRYTVGTGSGTGSQRSGTVSSDV